MGSLVYDPDGFESEQRARMNRGLAAVHAYLQAYFPGYVIETLEYSDADRRLEVRTFEVRKGGEHYRVRVTEDVLDRGNAGRLHGLARRLRQEGTNKILVVTESGLRAEAPEGQAGSKSSTNGRTGK